MPGGFPPSRFLIVVGFTSINLYRCTQVQHESSYLRLGFYRLHATFATIFHFSQKIFLDDKLVVAHTIDLPVMVLPALRVAVRPARLAPVECIFLNPIGELIVFIGKIM